MQIMKPPFVDMMMQISNRSTRNNNTFFVSREVLLWDNWEVADDSVEGVSRHSVQNFVEKMWTK